MRVHDSPAADNPAPDAPAPGRSTGLPSIVAAIITYNNADSIAAAVASIRQGFQTGASAHRILVIDNASSDDTVALAGAMDGVTVVETGANLGYSGAINVARGFLAEADAIAVLNPDLVLAPGALETLRQALSEPRVGIAVPLLRDPDGSVYPHLRREPSIVGSLGDAVLGAHWRNRPRVLSDTLRRDSDYRMARDVDWAGGAALVVSPECSSAVGDWDSGRYFLYSEETDYARRARDAGYLVRFIPTAEATHVGGGSGQSAELLALMGVNRVRYFESHHSAVATAAFHWVVVLHHLLRSADPRHRFAARTIASRASWPTLPSAPAPSVRAPSVPAPAAPGPSARGSFPVGHGEPG
ncbi:MAG: N-acetylglucosaminyl-diphospho-decaprenol L-rhamnosyltransferase [Microbacteriaceae bacterium]|nr:N-acetylglucosaminyl-diphospho-decaprenol L-rhamnosyltransferase [Microbacteriaceae bacterium]